MRAESTSWVIPDRLFSVRAAAPVAVDADLREWAPLRFALERWPIPGGGTASASLRFDVRRDRDFLYLAFDVRDPTPGFSKERVAEDQDGVTVELDARPDPARSENQGVLPSIADGTLAVPAHHRAHGGGAASGSAARLAARAAARRPAPRGARARRRLYRGARGAEPVPRRTRRGSLGALPAQRHPAGLRTRRRRSQLRVAARRGSARRARRSAARARSCGWSRAGTARFKRAHPAIRATSSVPLQCSTRSSARTRLHANSPSSSRGVTGSADGRRPAARASTPHSAGAL